MQSILLLWLCQPRCYGESVAAKQVPTVKIMWPIVLYLTATTSIGLGVGLLFAQTMEGIFLSALAGGVAGGIALLCAAETSE